jgi:hypothetical protein
MIQVLTHVFIIYCIIFTLWMAFRWSKRAFEDMVFKVSLFLISVIGIVIELKLLKII